MASVPHTHTHTHTHTVLWITLDLPLHLLPSLSPKFLKTALSLPSLHPTSHLTPQVTQCECCFSPLSVIPFRLRSLALTMLLRSCQFFYCLFFQTMRTFRIMGGGLDFIPLCVCSIMVLRTYLTQGAYSRTITLSELLFSSCGKKQHVLSFLSCSGHDARNGHIHLLSHLYSKKAFLQLTQFRLSEARSHSQ